MGASSASLSELKAEHFKKLGDAALKAGNHKDAWTRYSEAIKLANTRDLRTKLLANRSLAFCKAQRYDQGLQDAQSLLQERPGWDKAWFRRATALQGLQQLPDAVSAYRKAYYLSKGESSCRQALWRVLQRLTREELAEFIIGLTTELQLKGAIPDAQLEIATDKEKTEAMFMHINAADRQPAQKSHASLYHQCMSWATNGIPPAVALTMRARMYTNAKCYVQAAADAKAAIQMLEAEDEAGGKPSSDYERQAALALAYEALGAALQAEPEHLHQDQAGAVKAFVMAMEHAPNDDALRDRLHAAEEKLSAEQLAKAQAELCESGKSMHAMHLVHGVLADAQSGTQHLRVDVSLHLPQVTVKDVTMAVRAALHTGLASCAGVALSQVQLDGIQNASAASRPAGTSAELASAQGVEQLGAVPGVLVALAAHVGGDEGKARQLVAAAEDGSCWPHELRHQFPGMWASSSFINILPAAIAQPSDAQAADDEADQQSSQKAIVPVRPEKQLALPYGSYRLVHAGGAPVERIDKHPFCMSRVYYAAADRPQEVWAELADGSCRWRQTGSEVKVIALQVPCKLPARDLAVVIQPHSVKIMNKHTGEVYLEGRLWRGIVPQESLWMQGNGQGEDGCLLLLRKMNLELLTRHWQHSEMWWARLFQHHCDIAWDDYEKDYSDLPHEILRRHHAVEAEREVCRQLEAAQKSAREALQGRNDVRKQRRQARLHEMRAGKWTHQDLAQS